MLRVRAQIPCQADDVSKHARGRDRGARARTPDDQRGAGVARRGEGHHDLCPGQTCQRVRPEDSARADLRFVKGGGRGGERGFEKQATMGVGAHIQPRAPVSATFVAQRPSSKPNPQQYLTDATFSVVGPDESDHLPSVLDLLQPARPVLITLRLASAFSVHENRYTCQSTTL